MHQIFLIILFAVKSVCNEAAVQFFQDFANKIWSTVHRVSKNPIFLDFKNEQKVFLVVYRIVPFDRTKQILTNVAVVIYHRQPQH